jgi:hypothetical protein
MLRGRRKRLRRRLVKAGSAFAHRVETTSIERLMPCTLSIVAARATTLRRLTERPCGIFLVNGGRVPAAAGHDGARFGSGLLVAAFSGTTRN